MKKMAVKPANIHTLISPTVLCKLDTETVHFENNCKRGPRLTLTNESQLFTSQVTCARASC